MLYTHRWFDQRQIEALVTGKEVLAKDEEGPSMGPRNEGGGVRTAAAAAAAAEAAADAAEAAEAAEAAAATAGLKRADSPPPTDLNSFLESV